LGHSDPSVIVGVLDTRLKASGVSDYDGQVVPGWNVLMNSSDTSSSAGNHGTYVAGVVGLALGNGVGNAGYSRGDGINKGPETHSLPSRLNAESPTGEGRAPEYRILRLKQTPQSRLRVGRSDPQPFGMPRRVL
jgi:subtilisin family serine protease